ncbi:MAG: T9SS type A sorting domain-containing protein, partial [Ignavibacteriaceae bacterium]|nr:T9SS type A sorting domain-containing protein [Ignavibacteriaceae bacterium]
PINYSNGISQPVKIKWFTSSGADSYKLQISSDSTFTSVIIDTTGITDTSISITGLSNLTTYYWRVNATNVEGTSPWSNIWSFRTLGNPTRPAIIYPAANSTNIPLNINFTWGKAKDEITSDNITKSSKQSSKLLGFSETNKTTTVSNYWMQLATDTTGTNYFVNDSTLTDTTKLVSGLNYYTNYYWRVRAMNESGWGAYTGWSMFTTIIDTPAIVQQISPAYGSIDSVMPVQLTWSSSARAATYRLQFSKDSTFTTAIIDTAGQTDTTFTFYELKNLITYYWRINATNAGGTSAWSNVWKFQIYVDPSLAVLAYPASNSINIPVDLNFRWSNAQDQLMLSKVGSGKANRKSITKAGLPGNKKIAGLSRYWFQLMADTTSKSYISNDSTLTDTVKFVSGLTNLTQYWWRVRVFYDTAWGACTNWSKFITVIDTPDIVQLSVPIDSSNGNILPIKFNWFSSARAATYRLQISSDSTFTTSEIDSLGLKDTSFYVNKLNSLTKYYWRVNASNAGGACSWSSIWNFKTLGNPTQAILVYPGNNSVNIPVTVNFSWNKSQEQLAIAKLKVNMKNAKTITNAGASGKKKISNVSRYWFELMTDTTITNFVVNDSTLTDTTKTVSGLRNLTNYWWRVKGMNETGWGTYTNWSKFTTIVDTPGIATLISPNGSSRILETAISVLFTWEKAPYASTYEYQIASDKNFGTVYWDTTNVSDTVSMYYGMVTSTFYWRVRGSNIAGTGSWSEVMTVSTVTGTDRISKDIPIAYELYQNYPNPFNPSSKIRYALPFNSNVKIEIYNVLGQKVKEILNEEKAAGYYEVNFNTTGLASGVYLYMIYVKSTDGKSEFRNVKKMVLLK